MDAIINAQWITIKLMHPHLRSDVRICWGGSVKYFRRQIEKLGTTHHLPAFHIIALAWDKDDNPSVIPHEVFEDLLV